MTVFEPDKATWNDGGLLVEASAITGEIRLRWAVGARPAHLVADMTMTADQVERAEAMLMNARLWLRKSAAQHAEVAAAEQLADDEPVCSCGHPMSDHGFTCNRCACTAAAWKVRDAQYVTVAVSPNAVRAALGLSADVTGVSIVRGPVGDVQACECCGHPYHDKAVCDVCDCDLRRVWQLPVDERPACTCYRGQFSVGGCRCTCPACVNPFRYYPIPTETTTGRNPR